MEILKKGLLVANATQARNLGLVKKSAYRVQKTQRDSMYFCFDFQMCVTYFPPLSPLMDRWNENCLFMQKHRFLPAALQHGLGGNSII